MCISKLTHNLLLYVYVSCIVLYNDWTWHYYSIFLSLSPSTLPFLPLLYLPLSLLLVCLSFVSTSLLPWLSLCYSLSSWLSSSSSCQVDGKACLRTMMYVYNERVASWEPLLEPVEDNQLQDYQPYTLDIKVCGCTCTMAYILENWKNFKTWTHKNF